MDRASDYSMSGGYGNMADEEIVKSMPSMETK